MATETVASSQIPITGEQVEKKMSEDEKASEHDSVLLHKGSGEEIPKTEDSASIATPSESESVDYKKIEPPLVEAEKTTDAPVPDTPIEVETTVENELVPDPETPNVPKQVADAVERPLEVQSPAESVLRETPKEPEIGTIEIGQVEQPEIVDAPQSSIEAIEKPEEPLEVTSDKGSASSAIPLVDEPKVESEQIPDSQAPNIPKQVADAVDSLAKVQTNIEPLVGEPPKESSIDIIEIGQVEKPKIVDAPQSSVEAIEKQEELVEVTSEKGSVATVLEEIKDSEPEVQKPELAIAEVEEEPEDQSEFTQKVVKNHDEVEPEEHVHDEKVKDEGSVADKVEHTTSLEEGKTETDDTPTLAVVEEKTETDDTPTLAVEEETEQPKLTEELHDEVEPEISVEDERLKDEGSSIDKVEQSSFLVEGATDRDDKPSLIGIPEEPSLSREAQIELLDEGESSLPDITELSGVEKLSEETALETEKVGEENVETEKNEKSNEIPEVSTQPIKEGQQEELCEVDVVEKLVEQAQVKLEKAGEKDVETEEDGKRSLIAEDSIQPIIEDQKKELNGADVTEELAEEPMVKFEKVGEENVAKNVETEDEKRNVITGDSTLPIQEDQMKESGEADVVEKLAEKAAVKLEKVGEEKVAKNDGIKETEKRNVTTEDSTQLIEEDRKKELNGVDVVEKIVEEAVVKTEKFGEENETKNVKFEDYASKNVINEVSTQPPEEDLKSSISPSEVIEKSLEGAGNNVEPAAESERAEHIKDEAPAKVETKKDESIEEKRDEVTRAVNETLNDSKQSESEVKGEETAETGADKLETVVEDSAKSEQNVDPPPAKDGEQTKPSKDLPREVPAKPSQKQSNTILSKVKQSLVKAKKAITGKSPGSKTPASGTKDDIKVKE